MPPFTVASLQTIMTSRPGDAADAGDEAGAVDRLAIHAVGGERRQLEERRAGIEQVGDALARQQLSARQMALAGALRPAGGGLGAPRLQFRDERAHASALPSTGRRIEARRA